jgi:uncharacterized protein (DUF58 family)
MKEFEAETNLRCYLVLDCSASMSFAGKQERKIDFAKRLIASLAYLVVHQGDAAGLVCASQKAVFDVPPRRNPAHLQNILETWKKPNRAVTPACISVLHDLAEKIRRRALVIVFLRFLLRSRTVVELFSTSPISKARLAGVSFAGPDGAGFQVRSARALRRFGKLAQLVTEPAMIREEYLRQLQTFLERLKAGCHEFKADYRQVTTDQDYEKTLADFSWNAGGTRRRGCSLKSTWKEAA